MPNFGSGYDRFVNDTEIVDEQEDNNGTMDSAAVTGAESIPLKEVLAKTGAIPKAFVPPPPPMPTTPAQIHGITNPSTRMEAGASQSLQDEPRKSASNPFRRSSKSSLDEPTQFYMAMKRLMARGDDY